jgi:hypothetical protein
MVIDPPNIGDHTFSVQLIGRVAHRYYKNTPVIHEKREFLRFFCII